MSWLKPDRHSLKPECYWRVGLVDEVITSRSWSDEVRSVSVADIEAVYVEANDSGPWGADVWWIIEGATPNIGCVFPQGATGENVVIQRLQQFAGFEINGMNSVASERFLCWRKGGAGETAA